MKPLARRRATGETKEYRLEVRNGSQPMPFIRPLSNAAFSEKQRFQKCVELPVNGCLEGFGFFVAREPRDIETFQ